MTDRMIEVENSGYSLERGLFCDLYYIDSEKTDYEIHFPDGDVYRQTSAFHSRIEDWNHDGESYEQFGAFFEIASLGRGEFITPVIMVELLTEHQCTIPGIEMKTITGKKHLLDEKLKKASNNKSINYKSNDKEQEHGLER